MIPGIFLKNVHKDKHGSDTGTYDTEGRFLPQKFEDIFAKYAEGRDYLTIWDVSNVLRGQRCIADPIGWGGAFFECGFNSCPCLHIIGLTKTGIATYIMLWPKDGRMMKEDIRGIYDGSIFYTIAERREKSS
jgi:peroxygenase